MPNYFCRDNVDFVGTSSDRKLTIGRRQNQPAHLRPSRIIRSSASVVVLVSLACLGTGCGSRAERPSPRLIGFDLVITNAENAYSRLVTLQPKTLQLHGRTLALRDVTTDTTWVAATSSTGQLSPDRRTLAVGGSVGEIILVDPAKLRRLGTIRIRRSDDLLVAVDSWAKPNRLLAVYGRISAINPINDSIAVIDPIRRRVVRRVSLEGGVEFAAKVADGSLVLLVERNYSHARLVVVSPDGGIRALVLPDGGIRPAGGRFAGRYFRAERGWAVATDGRERAFLARAGAPLLEVNLKSLAVRRHRPRLRLATGGLPQPPAGETPAA